MRRVTRSGEPGLVAHDYVFAYFDGLNRYYVAAEHDELLAALRVQPNVLDGFRRASDVSAEKGVRAAQRAVADATRAADDAAAEARQATAEAALAREQAAQSELRAVAAEARAAQSAADIATVASSASWRVTSPLRLRGAGRSGVPRGVTRTALGQDLWEARRRPPDALAARTAEIRSGRRPAPCLGAPDRPEDPGRHPRSRHGEAA